MPVIPLGIGAWKRDNSFQPEILLHNLVLEKDDSGASPDKFFRIQRPGLDAYKTIGSPVQGLFRQDGVLSGNPYGVGGGTLYRVDTQAVIGAVNGTGNAAFAPTVGKIGIVRTPNAYTYNGTTLSSLTIPDGYDATSLDQLNGYLIFYSVTGRFYWLVPGDTAIDPLDFATTESSPDGGVAVVRLVDDLFFFGKETTEVWQSTGDNNAPFQRAPGRLYDKGCLNKDTAKRFDNAIVWVTNDLRIMRTGQVPQDIGSPFLSERLRKRSGDPSATVLKFDDHEMYVLRIPGQGSFAYDASTQQWTRFGTIEKDQWDVGFIVDVANGQIGASAESGAVWTLNPETSNDDGQVMERYVSGNLALTGRPVRNDSFSLGIGCAENTTVSVNWRDGRDAYPEWPELLEVRAPTDIVNLYRLGQMREPVRSFLVTITADVKVRISGATFGEAWQ